MPLYSRAYPYILAKKKIGISQPNCTYSFPAHQHKPITIPVSTRRKEPRCTLSSRSRTLAREQNDYTRRTLGDWGGGWRLGRPASLAGDGGDGWGDRRPASLAGNGKHKGGQEDISKSQVWIPFAVLLLRLGLFRYSPLRSRAARRLGDWRLAAGRPPPPHRRPPPPRRYGSSPLLPLLLFPIPI